MNQELNAYVPDVIFEKIPIKNLVSCQDYQRSLSESQILKIAKEFDLHQINPVKVSRRDGVNYVFDGQHTIEAVALVSHFRDTPVWCMIYDHLCYCRKAVHLTWWRSWMSKTGCYENPYAVTGGEAVHSWMQAQRKDLKIPHDRNIGTWKAGND